MSNGDTLTVLWLSKAQSDLALDRTTWTSMIREMTSLGHRVHLVTSYKERKDAYPSLGGNVTYVRRVPWPFLHHASVMISLSIETARRMRRAMPDVIICDPWTIPAVVGPVLCRRLSPRKRPRVVVDVRTLPVRPGHGFKALAEQVVFLLGIRTTNAFADGVTPITEAMHDELIDRYRLETRLPSCCWTSGFDESVFGTGAVRPADVTRARQSLGVREDEVVVLYHGVMTENRGLGSVVEAMSVLRRSGRPRPRVVFLGSGAAREALEAQVACAALGEDIMFRGPVAHEVVPAYIHASDAGLIPLPDFVGWRVSSPLKLLEYLGAGKPLLVTDIQAHRNVLGDDFATVYLGDGNRGAIAAGLESAARLGRDGLIRLAAMRRLDLKEYSWSHQAGCLLNFLTTLACDERRR